MLNFTSSEVGCKEKLSISCRPWKTLGCTESRSLGHPLLWVQFHSSRLGLRCSLWWPQVDELPRMPSLRESIWPELTIFILGSICYFYVIPIGQDFKIIIPFCYSSVKEWKELGFGNGNILSNLPQLCTCLKQAGCWQGRGRSGQYLVDLVGEVCLDLIQESEKLSSHNLGCFFGRIKAISEVSVNGT